jgi:hypothetical protein
VAVCQTSSLLPLGRSSQGIWQAAVFFMGSPFGKKALMIFLQIFIETVVDIFKKVLIIALRIEKGALTMIDYYSFSLNIFVSLSGPSQYDLKQSPR